MKHHGNEIKAHQECQEPISSGADVVEQVDIKPVIKVPHIGILLLDVFQILQRWHKNKYSHPKGENQPNGFFSSKTEHSPALQRRQRKHTGNKKQCLHNESIGPQKKTVIKSIAIKFRGHPMMGSPPMQGISLHGML